MNVQFAYAAAVLVAYLFGSISCSILISQWMRLPDPRSLGSGNPGATNMLRTGSKNAAVFTLIGDLLKGLIPLVIARWLGFELSILCLMGLAATIGHMYPIYYKFRGGKGIATTLGVLFGISWLLAIIWIAIWISVAILTRYSSLAAIVATILLPVTTFILTQPIQIILVTTIIMLLIVWRHRSNIRNLIDGSESKIGAKN